MARAFSWRESDVALSWVLQSRLGALDEQWQFLVNKSAEKSQKLKEANKQQNFNTGIKDFDFWLSEVRQAPHPAPRRRHTRAGV